MSDQTWGSDKICLLKSSALLVVLRSVQKGGSISDQKKCPSFAQRLEKVAWLAIVPAQPVGSTGLPCSSF